MTDAKSNAKSETGSDTKARLRAATLRVLVEVGVAGLSARVIAAEAQTNQGLIFYHFATVDALVGQACRASVDERIGAYREELADVQTIGELLAVGERLHVRERELGNVAVMAQLMAGAQHNPVLREAAGYAMSRWNEQIEQVLLRVLTGNPLRELVDVQGLARAVSAGFIGLELYEGVDADSAELALDGLRRLVLVIDGLGELGPTAKSIVRETMRRVGR